MQARLKNYRQAPRKMRLVADLVKGKGVSAALEALAVLPKRAATPLVKLIKSAVANAKQGGLGDEARLVIRSIRVDQGTTLKRWRPRARGVSNRIRKRQSRISVKLEAVS